MASDEQVSSGGFGGQVRSLEIVGGSMFIQPGCWRNVFPCGRYLTMIGHFLSLVKASRLYHSNVNDQIVQRPTPLEILMKCRTEGMWATAAYSKGMG